MPKVLYTAAPTDTPQGPGAIPGGGYQHLDVNPSQFGALQAQGGMLQAQGLQHLSAGIEAAGTQVWDAYRDNQNLYNQITADQQSNQYQDTVTKTLYGDPDHNDPGFYGLSGEDAMRAYPGVRDKLVQARAQLGAGLNPRAKLAFDNETRRLQLFSLEQMGRHYDGQMRVHGKATNAATIQNAVQAAGNDYLSDEAATRATVQATDAGIKNLELAGEATDPAQRKRIQDHSASVIGEARVKSAIAHNDYRAAGALLDRYDSVLDENTRAQLATAIRGKRIDQEARDLVYGSPGSFRGGGAARVTPGQVSDAARAAGVDPALANAVAAVESGHGANVGQGEHAATRGNIFQMGPAERASVGGSRQSMGSPDEQIRQGVAFLADKKRELAGALGRDPTNAEIYLAHQQGTGAAVSLLANPNTPAGQLVPPKNIAANGGDPNAPASQFVAKTAQLYASRERQFAQGPGLTATDAGPAAAAVPLQLTPEQQQVPGLSEKIAQIRASTSDPDVADKAVQIAQQDYTAQWVDRERQRTQREQAVNAAAEHAASDIVSRLIKDPTSVDPGRDIADNPALADKHALKESLFKMQQSSLHEGNNHDIKTYGSGFYQAYSAVHAPQDDPNRITDPSQVYSRVGPNGDLTVAGAEKLVAALQSRRTPEGEAWSEMQKQFFKNAHAQISGKDDLLHMSDSKGEELFLKFMAQALPAIEKGRTSGKSPSELLDPNSPEYIGKIIPGFVRPRAQRIADMKYDLMGIPATPEAFLRQDPDRVFSEYGGKTARQLYDEKYGAGAAEKVLGAAPATPVR